MMISLSGTPGTGKTSVAHEFDTARFKVVSMNELSTDYTSGRDEERGSEEVDIALMTSDIAEGRFRLPLPEECGNHLVIEGHLSHHLPVDIIFVLRTSTRELRTRLEGRNYSAEKVRENMEAEAMGLITLEALDTSIDAAIPVYEIDTSETSPSEVANRCEEIILGSPSPPLDDPADMIDFTEEILEWY